MHRSLFEPLFFAFPTICGAPINDEVALDFRSLCNLAWQIDGCDPLVPNQMRYQAAPLPELRFHLGWALEQYNRGKGAIPTGNVHFRRLGARNPRNSLGICSFFALLFGQTAPVRPSSTHRKSRSNKRDAGHPRTSQPQSNYAIKLLALWTEAICRERLT